jgi:electron transfer flavoprotein alpha subunit
MQIDSHHVLSARQSGQIVHEVLVSGPIIATLCPGSRGFDPIPTSHRNPAVELLNPPLPDNREIHDPDLLEVLPPDPATVDLAEATRIVSGGLGLGSEDFFRRLAAVAHAIGASYGGTRAAADRGWVPTERFIGTTGVHVNPELYIALGISGAVQHTSGLGRPKHIISVNLDRGCPMMAMADLAIVGDARAVIEELAVRLGIEVTALG